MDKGTLRKVQIVQSRLKQLELDILKNFHNYCVKHKLRYFLTYGTLLGAVRHKGFIPWDDDVDVCMPRTDYDEFISRFPLDELNKQFQVASLNTLEGYYLPFAKLIRRDTILEEKVCSNLKLGVYIDIFPLDNMSDDYNKACGLFKNSQYLRKIYMIKNISFSKSRSLWKNLVLFLCKIATFWLPLKTVLKSLIEKSSIYKNKKLSRFVCSNVLATYGIKEILQGEWYNQSVLLPFEDSSFFVPKDYHQILEHFYGDYMQLPPKEKQTNHHNFVAYQLIKEK